jgi:hypothetical protein
MSDKSKDFEDPHSNSHMKKQYRIHLVVNDNESRKLSDT